MSQPSTATPPAAQPLLFTPLPLRGVTLPNRVAISPMCTYSGIDGMATDWHFANYARYAIGGAGLVMVEATTVHERGRITYGDLGLWQDAQIEPHRRIASFLKQNGSVPAVQLAHAGRKAASQRPWHGNGALNETDRQLRGEVGWPTLAPSPIPVTSAWPAPSQVTMADLDEMREAWRVAALRALEAGYEIIEMHSAHGYSLHQYLSPISNKRNDAYGGDRAGCMRFPLEVAEAIRGVWPKDKPMFVRISCVDGVEGGWDLDDSVVYARELKARGVDVIDCSSGGLAGSATAAPVPRGPGFQVAFSDRIRREAEVATMAVGMIQDGPQAESILQKGQADIIAIGREALIDPNWAVHAELALGKDALAAYGSASWPEQYRWWLQSRERQLRAHRKGS